MLHKLELGPIAANCYVLGCGNGKAIVIDIGGNPEKLRKLLAEQHLGVAAILITHGHYDHIGGVEAIRKAFDAPVYIHEADADMLSDSQKNLAWQFDRNFQPVTAFETLTDGQTLTIGNLTVEVLHTPGHTSGGVCYRIDRMLFTGDTLFRGGIGRLDLGDGDASAMKQSLRKLVALEGDYEVYPGHMEASTLDRERKQNPYLMYLGELDEE